MLVGTENQEFIVYARAVNIISNHSFDGGQETITTRRAASARLTHLDARGQIRMVDVGEKPITRREAIARGEDAGWRRRRCRRSSAGKLKKGEALAAARIAGIMAAKRTHEMIPLCHQIPLEVVEVDFASSIGQLCAANPGACRD